MPIYVTGDIHGEIVKRFSNKQHPELRELTESDTIIVTGDFSAPWFNPEIKYYDMWTKPNSNKEEHYKLNFLNNKPWTTVIICGNHDNYDLIHKMPLINYNGAKVHQCTYENQSYEKILYIGSPQVMTLEGFNFLMIPGAESHDADYIFEWNDPDTKRNAKYLDYQYYNFDNAPSYRINHFSWWADEKISPSPLVNLNITSIDYIITHDCPAAVLSSWKPMGAPGRIAPSESEKILEQVRQEVDYKLWIHGHLHEEFYLPQYKTRCIYTIIDPLEDIVEEAEDENINYSYFLNTIKK